MTDLLDATDSETTSGRRSIKTIVAIVAVGVIVLGAAIWWFVLRNDAPAAFDNDEANVALEADIDGGSDAAAAIEDAAASFDGDPTGTWTVNPDLGAEAGGSQAGYRVDEELSGRGAITVVGRTTEVAGTVEIDASTVTTAEIVVDMASVATDESRRDGRYRSALKTDEFPTSMFVLTEPIDLGTVPGEDESITVEAIGEMTIAGVTNPVIATIDARINSGVLLLTGSVDVVFSDYGVDTPSAPIVISLDDEGQIEFQLFLTR